MSELPAPLPRQPIHTRRITFQAYLRDDDLWDIDCELSDTKAMDTMREIGVRKAGDPVHLLRVRLTVDDSFTIRAVQTATPAIPFTECSVAADEPMQKLVGLTMGLGWRKKIEAAIGGVGGCTHLRELVFNAATAAFQTIPGYRERQRSGGSRPAAGPGDQPPFYMGKCMTWAFAGPVVQRTAPMFYRIRKSD